jgi:signal peptidase II
LNSLISLATLLIAFKTPDLQRTQVIALLLIASGGLGNLLDRLLNQGAAIDFLNLGVGPVRTGIFNVADVLIVGGAGLFMLVSLRDRKSTTAT